MHMDALAHHAGSGVGFALLQALEAGQRRLGDHATEVLLHFHEQFGTDVTLHHEMRLEPAAQGGDMGITVRLHHLFAAEGDPADGGSGEAEWNEFGMEACLTVHASGQTVGTRVWAHLDGAVGLLGPGLHELRATSREESVLQDALDALREEIDALTAVRNPYSALTTPAAPSIGPTRRWASQR
ncbi:hypothetical protein [Streptomyces lavendofoliae]|uniref:Uncharacterized protein n=1 Tax=Streptomyces lavendofoliae TaxID=67314 RepID=A0A918I1Z7_9ACTN|nr:hypothetical protein [Streptomyces lavendofoliae]GGU58271.1 hypothetical protein GCM10010274_54030 [Streptomyces lavendofoliae]